LIFELEYSQIFFLQDIKKLQTENSEMTCNYKGKTPQKNTHTLLHLL